MRLADPGWRAFDTFRWALAAAVLAFLLFLGASAVLRAAQGSLTSGEARLLLGLLYWGTYPLVFVALGALAWHFVAFYGGRYARR